MSAYRTVLIETYLAQGEPSRKKIRARPVAGQGLDPAMHVECSSSMRMGHPVGTIFMIDAKITSKEGGQPFIYTSWQWKSEVVSKKAAEKFIAEGGWRTASSR